MAEGKAKAARVDEQELARDLRARLASDGAVKLASVKPAKLRGQVAARLKSEGFEVTKSFVRRPLATQLEEAVAHGALIPAKSLATHVRGASASELKQLVADGLRLGKVQLVLRGNAQVLCGPDAPVLSEQQLERVRSRLLVASKAIEKVTRAKTLRLLIDDVSSAIREVLEVLPARSAMPTKHSKDPVLAVLEAVESTRDSKTGLSFVPAVVGRLAPGLDAKTTIQLLLNAAEQDLLELRPEGGIGRLSEAELAVCPPGPHGTRLSWARRLAGGRV